MSMTLIERLRNPPLDSEQNRADMKQAAHEIEYLRSLTGPVTVPPPPNRADDGPTPRNEQDAHKNAPVAE